MSYILGRSDSELKKIFRQKGATDIHCYGTLHGVLQFADVARPSAFPHPFDRLLREPHRFVLPLAEAMHKVRQQQRNILAALTECRKLNMNDTETVEEVAAKRAGVQ